MRRTWQVVIAAALAAVCLAASCEEEESEAGKTDCEKADEIIAAVGEDYCGPKDDECCYCRCFNRSQVIDTSVADECACTPLGGDDADEQDAGASGGCEDYLLTEAQTCLDDREACEADYLKKMQSGCLMSPID